MELAITRLESVDPTGIPDFQGDWLARARAAATATTQRKEAISLRLDSDVLAWFRSQGGRYQSQINAVLRAYAEAQIDSTGELS